MKLANIIGVASAAVITSSAFAGEIDPNAFYKVKITAEATIQTDIDETSTARLDTGDIITALLADLETPGSNPAHFDIIASYFGDDDDILNSAVYYLARTRGPVADRYKIMIPSEVLSTDGGASVFKRVFTAKSSTLKVNITDAFSGLFISTTDISVESSGLTKAQVTVKNVDTEEEPFLSLVKGKFTGHHVVELGTFTEDQFGVGSISANIGGAVKKATFDSLTDLTPAVVPVLTAE